MKVHLIGGFMGSGKSTAVSAAREMLKSKGVTTSLIKDNNVGYVINKLPQVGNGVSLAKVNGSCSCCSYYELYFQIHSLKKQLNPEVIFAEYSGTCNNLIDSLLKPLREAVGNDFELANFSTFVDARKLLSYLQGKELPLCAEDKYTWERHVKEAELLIVNKIDLLSEEEQDVLQSLTKNIFDSKEVLFLNSNDKASINNWIEIIGKPQSLKHKENGENAWLDEEIEFTAIDGNTIEYTHEFIRGLSEEIFQKRLSVEHLQFILSYNGKTSKIQYTNSPGDIPGISDSPEKADLVDLMINARIQTSPEELRQILFNALSRQKERKALTVRGKFISYYQAWNCI